MNMCPYMLSPLNYSNNNVLRQIYDYAHNLAHKKATAKYRSKFFSYKTNKSRRYIACSYVAAESGFEPEQSESESLVLPLHYSAIFCLQHYYYNTLYDYCQHFSIDFGLFVKNTPKSSRKYA